MSDDAARWQRLQVIVQSALDRPAGERAAFLASACAGDDELRREATSLVEHDDRASAFLATPLAALAAGAVTYSPGGAADAENARDLMGARLGAYEIRARLGAGGMGEVYRAYDHALHRDVAIKVLPAAFVGDSERLARFEREARLLASLNHPHIGAVYGIAGEGDLRGIVLELIDGETLEARLARGAIPVSQALSLAQQIARALDHAHQHGVMHRDLKPANIMLTKSGAKLLDFGLAKWGDQRRGYVSTSGSSVVRPEGAESVTSEGTILGTLHYMAPEQLEGKRVDSRADVFAFGAVLYEVLTGKRAFDGASTAAVMAAVLNTEPSLAAVKRLASPGLERILRKCLAKDPDNRWQTVRDLGDELQWISEDTRQPQPLGVGRGARPVRLNRWATLSVAALALVLAGWVGWQFETGTSDTATAELYLEISTPRTVAPHEFALSPDGQSIVASVVGHGAGYLWVRQLNTAVSREFEGGSFPFWSPDSRSIGYFRGGQLKRVDLIDRKIRTLASVEVGRGGSWGSDGTILFASSDGPIMRVSATGGEARAATRIAAGQTAHRFPQFLSDNQHFLYYAVGTDGQQGLYLTSLDGVGTRIADADSAAAVLSNDRLIFNTQGVIAVHQLDLKRGALVGEPQTLIESAPINPYLALGVSVAANGAIAYRAWVDQRQLRWFDRRGTPLGQVGEPSRDGTRRARLSADGKRLALDRVVLGNRDVYIRDLFNGATTRFTTDRSLDGFPVWSPNGSEIAFQSDRNGAFDIFVKSTAGTGPEKELLRAPGNQWPIDWSRDGRWLLYVDAANAGDLWAMPMVGQDRTPVPVARSMFAELDAALSPDGHWIAYPSNESGSNEIVVQSFPQAREKWSVSVNGGLGPEWSANGRELFFVAPDGKLMVVPVQATSETFKYGAASALFQTRIVNTSIPINGAEFALSADGRILVNEAVDDIPAPITVILNWKARVK